jgi:hypothetical protein
VLLFPAGYWTSLELAVPLTPEQRALRSRIASSERWSRTADRAAATAPARQAFLDRFERQVDPDGTLDPAERAKRAEYARKAYFARLALKSSIARSRASRANAEADAADRELAEFDGGEAA